MVTKLNENDYTNIVIGDTIKIENYDTLWEQIEDLIKIDIVKKMKKTSKKIKFV